MSIKSKVLAAAAALTLAGAMAAGGIAVATQASAATLTCTNIATATASPFGCGGLQSAGTALGTLDLAHTSNVYNSLVTVAPDTSNVSEDWTAFQVVAGGIPFPGLNLNGAGGLGIYVAMDTPDGNIPVFTPTVSAACTIGSTAGTERLAGTLYVNTEPCPGQPFTTGANDLCISVEHASHVPGTNGKLRWWSVLRSCSTNGVFTYGSGPSDGHPGGTAGTVTAGFANQWQAWAPVVSSKGYILVNTWLYNHDNVNYVLDITGNGGAGSVVQAYPENDQVNEEWGLIGCTLPASHLGGVVTPPYVNCPL
jgi:hypothetical protein